MFGNVLFLKRYYSNNQCTVTTKQNLGLLNILNHEVLLKDQSWILLWKYAAHLTVFQKVWLYFINFILKVKVKVTETRNWLKCVIFSHI